MHAVAEFKQIVLEVLQYSEILFSNSFVSGPVVIHPDFKVFITLSISSLVISGGEKGIFLFNLDHSISIIYSKHLQSLQQLLLSHHRR